jgi:hypothetical protein
MKISKIFHFLPEIPVAQKRKWQRQFELQNLTGRRWRHAPVIPASMTKFKSMHEKRGKHCKTF